MARYRVKELSYIHDRLYEAGAEIEYDGQPGTNLEPIDKAAETVVKKLGVSHSVEEALDAQLTGNPAPAAAGDGAPAGTGETQI